MKRKLLLAVMFGLIGVLFLGASLAAAGDAGQQSVCSAYYTVRWGDTLAKIAASRGMSLRELLQLNQGRVRNPNLIYAGQILCVPAEYQVALQVTYHLNQDSQALRNLLGRQVVYKAQSIAVISYTADLRSDFSAFPPWLIGTHNTLYAVGDGRMLLPLVLTETQTLVTVWSGEPNSCDTKPFFELGAGLSDVATATLRLETGGTYVPFDLTRLGLVSTLSKALRCVSEDDVAFAIASAGPQYPDAYHVVVRRMEEKIFGPPGATRSFNCARWSGWGWFYRWLRGWYGC
jgi:hypothetical protein